MKIERLAGIPGKPAAEMLYGGGWRVCQYTLTTGAMEVYGPLRKYERSAVRAWNSMVKQIRKANAGEQKP